jgi:hypothetical protein
VTPEGAPPLSPMVTKPWPSTGSSKAIKAQPNSCGTVTASRRGPLRATSAPPTRSPATSKRVPAPNRGGISSTMIRIARYVEPQTTYTISSAMAMNIGLT